MAALFALPVPKLNKEKNELVDDFVNAEKNPGMEPAKLDMEIAKHLRFKVPRKSTMMQKQAVEYFVGSKAVDILMESKWALRKKGNDQLFGTRDDATRYLDELLQKRLFFRVMKTEKKSKQKAVKEGVKDSENDQNETEESKTIETPETKLGKRKIKKKAEAEDEKNDESETDKKKRKTKRNNKKLKAKKRYKFTHHEEQKFYDSKDVYIWLYNPISWKTVAMGMGVLLCVVAGTLLPLWPLEMRTGLYYLSIAGAILIGIIFAIALVRTILYYVIWLFTGGNHQLWILPNILADVGFFESFQPWYTYEYKESKDENEEDDEDKESEEDTNEEKSEDEVEDVRKGNASTQPEDCSQSENSQEASQSELTPQ